MKMSYTTNPHLPRVRMEAVRMVKDGHSFREVARHFGYAHNTILSWVKKAENIPSNAHLIPTQSSRPLSHPHALNDEVVDKIIELRRERRQCAEILHHRLIKEGIKVSLSSVKRVLKRNNMTRYSKWKKWHQYPPRPIPTKPGILVQIDTIHDGPHPNRLYIYTLIDVHSRWAYAKAVSSMSTHHSARFVREVKQHIPFIIQTLQSDHGPEFSKWFSKHCLAGKIQHRYSRVRRPTDNGHLERFNRTIQQECLRGLPRKLSVYRKAIPDYLHYYNAQRPHMGLDMKTPLEIIKQNQ